MSNQDFQIRALPRSNEKLESTKPGITATAAKISKQSWLYLGIAATGAIIGIVGLILSFSSGSKEGHNSASSESSGDAINARINRHLHESIAREEMIKRDVEAHEAQLRTSRWDSQGLVLESDDRIYGVQFDQENVAERLYQELNEDRTPAYRDLLPDEKISARLANRKWLNEMERAERVQFISNFIRSAYEQGYQVEIDQNLVVVGVKKITGTQKVNIDQVLDKMARQGQ